MASSSSSTQWSGGELILAASHGRPIAAYDALTGHFLAELPGANTPRHGLAVAAVPGTALVAASHVCPATGAGSIRLLQWCSPAPARELPVPEPVAAVVAAPYGSHLLAGGVSGRVYALALPSGAVARCFRAHGGDGSVSVSCLALGDDGSLLVSGGDDGSVAVFLLLDVLDVEAARKATADLALFRIAAHAAPVTCVACGRGGCNAVAASASADGACRVWRLADGGLLRTLALPCAALSLALDATSSSLYAGGSDGRVHAAPLDSAAANTMACTSQASDSASAGIIGVAVANGGRNLVSCSEDGGVRVWDLTHGGLLLLANAFWLGGAVSGVLVVKRLPREVARAGGEGFMVGDDVAWTRTRDVADMEEMLRSSEEEKAGSVALLEKNLGIHKRCLRLIDREATAVANGGSHDDANDGTVSD